MSEETDHTYAKLRLLSEASKWLEDNWEKMDYASRDRAWWQVHKASRDVWNILHHPKKKGIPSKLQEKVDEILGKKERI